MATPMANVLLLILPQELKESLKKPVVEKAFLASPQTYLLPHQRPLLPAQFPLQILLLLQLLLVLFQLVMLSLLLQLLPPMRLLGPPQRPLLQPVLLLLLPHCFYCGCHLFISIWFSYSSPSHVTATPQPVDKSSVTMQPSNSLHSQAKASVFISRLNLLPEDILMDILDKIQAPVLDTSNPFSILEHCTYKGQAYETSFCNLLPLRPLILESEDTTLLEVGGPLE
ncbi:hypothetical protein MRB53_028699 [Persea americana]|uniref:Uncharacterized protein n=1 Tax=Persea americana TaxID=3435 RepID=A0ACC2KGT9_PERAE|nr:hypothetical protein MRB53_028699 [Persea americana]